VNTPDSRSVSLSDPIHLTGATHVTYATHATDPSHPTKEAPAFVPVSRCWVCDGSRLTRYHQAPLEFHQYVDQDAELHAYTGESVWLVRCEACGFGQPERMPALPQYFDRMYAQQWSAEWVASEFDARYKDLVFRTVLRELDRRVGLVRRRLLDVGAHAGRFLHLAQQAGWEVEGVELNPRTAAYAAMRTGAAVYHQNAQALAAGGHRYSAVVLTDVLEHIPEPVQLLRTLAALTEPGGAIAVKVPCGPSQLAKERIVAALTSRRMSLADCLVHINHFSPQSLARALEAAGFGRISVRTGAPEVLPGSGWRVRLSNAVRLSVYAAARLPGAVHTPLALNLQAYASRP
jgi:SAM-dependent methyltransferase